MEVKYTIPDNLSEVKLRDYQKYISVTENNDDNDFLTMKLVEIFCKLKLNVVNQLPLLEIESIAEILNNTFKQKPKFKNRFTLDGVEYGFIPDLEKISMKEYVDIDLFIGSIENLHKLMAILYRPITMKKKDMYLIEEYDSDKLRDTEMLNAPMDIVLPAQVFFWNLGQTCLVHILPYLEKELKKDLAQKKTSQINGDGIRTLIHSLKETSLNLNKSLNLDYLNA